ncbi:MAG: hypothetical protein APF76_00170 [Desulfitibacter sp. BRH_c19]|nr:MAG: hypothetical protein APF76_00170 [Desulfitibacter sp. BRH_c19]
MDRLLIILIGVILIFALLTWGLDKIFRNRLYKFIPSFGAFLAGIINIYIARTSPGEGGFENLAKAVIAILLLSGALSGFITGIIMDTIIPMFRNRKTR